jgi:hypothetical protein
MAPSISEYRYTTALSISSSTPAFTARVSSKALPVSARHTASPLHILEISDHLPIKIEFIETREKVEALLPELEKRTGCGIIEMQETTILIPAKQCKLTR